MVRAAKRTSSARHPSRWARQRALTDRLAADYDVTLDVGDRLAATALLDDEMLASPRHTEGMAPHPRPSTQQRRRHHHPPRRIATGATEPYPQPVADHKAWQPRARLVTGATARRSGRRCAATTLAVASAVVLGAVHCPTSRGRGGRIAGVWPAASGPRR